MVDPGDRQDSLELPGTPREAALATERIAFQAALLNSVEQAVIATDLAGKITYINRCAERLYGWGHEEALGRDITLLIGDQELEQGAVILADLRAGRSWSGEFTVKRRDGSSFPAFVTDSPIHDMSGRLVGIVGISYDLSDRKRAERRAAEQSEYLKTVVETMDQGLLVMGADRRIVLFNKRAADMFDIPVEFLATAPSVRELKEWKIRRGEYDRRSPREPDPTQVCSFLDEPPVYERTRPNGLIIECRTVPLSQAGAVRTYTDITEHRRAEMELKASEERLLAILMSTSVVLWRGAPDGRVTHFEGLDREPWRLGTKLLGDEWQTLLHPGDRDRVVARRRALVMAGLPVEISYRFRDGKGRHRWVLSREVPLKDPDGNIREWVGTLTDVDEQTQAEARLRLRDRSLAAIAQGVIITDARLPDNPIIYVNPAFELLTGYSAGEVIGRNCRFLQGPDSDPKAIERIRGALKAGEAIQVELLNYRKDGPPFHNEITISPVVGNDGAISHFVGTQSDITERLKLQEHLRQNQKMEAVGQLTGGIAHDFNNLLTVVAGNAELIAEDSPEQATRELATTILEAAQRGAELTQRLLAFGRRQSLKPVSVSLDEVVESLVPMLRRTIGEDITLKLELGGSPLGALVDRSSLEGAILNLVVNSRDAMRQGGRLIIRTGERLAQRREGNLAPGQNAVFVSVADTGEGMSSETLARMFEPFFTTKEVGKGNGLGLPMVYGFAQQSGGNVTVESQLGRGTTVTIVLPAIVSAVAGSSKLTGGPAPLRGRERILLVEDEPQVLQFVTAQLLNLGYEVTAVGNGPDALRTIQQGAPFDLLMTDMVLPMGMSGIELAKAVRQIRPFMKVLYTSGYAKDVLDQHGGGGEDITLLQKPYRRRELAEMLRALLGREDEAAKETRP